MKTTQPNSIQLVSGTEASPFKLVNVVSPTGVTEHPQLTGALGYVSYAMRTRVAESLEGTYLR